MTEHSQKELEALMSLLEDPDNQVFDTVADRLIELGEEVVVPLERRWEATLKPELQGKIENLIKQIQFNVLQRGMDSWKSTGGTIIDGCTIFNNGYIGKQRGHGVGAGKPCHGHC